MGVEGGTRLGQEEQPRQITISAAPLLAELRSVLSGFGTFSHTLRDKTDYLPAPDSAAAREWEQDGSDELGVRTTFSLAATLLAAAQSNLEATARVLIEPLPELGVYPSARAAMENSARAWWLLEPDISLKERAARGIVERLNSLHESTDLERLLSQGQNAKERKQPAREKEVAADAAGQGYSVRYSSRRGYLLDEVPRPSATRLLRDMHGRQGEIAYKILSAAVHGTTYALIQGMEFLPSDRGGTGYIAQPDNKMGLLAFAVPYTGMTYMEAFGREVQLLGWHEPEWQSFRQYALTKFLAMVRMS